MSAIDLIIARGFGDQIRNIATSGSRAVEWQNQRKAEEQSASINDFNLQSAQQDQALQLQQNARLQGYQQAVDPAIARIQEIDRMGREAQASGQQLPPEILAEVPGLYSQIQTNALGVVPPTTALDMLKPEPAPKPPNSFVEYQLAQQDPNFAQFVRDRDASKGTTVTIDQRYGEKSNEELAKHDAGAYSTSINDGVTAAAELDQYRLLATNPALTGPTQDVRASLVQIASEFGVPVSEAAINQVSSLAGYKSVVNGLVLSKLQAQKGPQTENDARRIEQSVAATTNLRDVNKVIIDYAAALADRRVELAEVAERYRQEKGTIDGFSKAQREYVVGTPLSGINKKTGQLVFWNQYREYMQLDNPYMSQDDIRAQWKRDYGP